MIYLALVINWLSLNKSSLIFPYLQLARLDKPWGIVLLAWPTLTALCLVHTKDIGTWIVFILGIILTRSAGCVINDYADRWLDGRVSRTKNRPLANQSIHPYKALGFFTCLLACCSLLLFFLNLKAQILSIYSAILMMIYPYTKRFFFAPQAFLSIVFSLGIPIAYANANISLGWQGWGLFLITAYWVVVYDTIYALIDIEDDMKANVHTLAITLGKYAHAFIRYSYLLIWLLWGIWGVMLAWPFYISWVFLGISYYQQIQDMTSQHYFNAFLKNQLAGLVLFLGVLLSISVHILY
jgi:4-hydroxybenzoate polyprenyltransferase